MKYLILILLLLTTQANAKSIDIIDAARAGDVKEIEEYIAAGGKVEVANERGYTPFIMATYYGNNAAAKKLLEAGADACALDDQGNNAYMGVAFKGFAHTATWLLNNTKCDINQRNYAGQTALMMASLFGQEDVVKVFLKHGADASIVDAQGNTAESLAKGQGLDNVIDVIKFYRAGN